MGKAQLKHISTTTQLTNNRITEHQKLIDEANSYGAKLDSKNLTRDLLGKDQEEIKQHLSSIKEEYHNKYQIDNLRKNSKNTTDINKTFEELQKEQTFLAGLYPNLNNHNYDELTKKKIEKAYESEQHQGLYNFKKAAHYAYKSEIIAKNDLAKMLVKDQHIKDMHHNINDICYNHHRNILNDHCQKLIKGEGITHQGHKFNNIIKYLEHWKDNVDHHMLPIKRMDQVIEQEQQKQAHLEYHHTLEL